MKDLGGGKFETAHGLLVLDLVEKSRSERSSNTGDQLIRLYGTLNGEPWTDQVTIKGFELKMTSFLGLDKRHAADWLQQKVVEWIAKTLDVECDHEWSPRANIVEKTSRLVCEKCGRDGGFMVGATTGRVIPEQPKPKLPTRKPKYTFED